MGSASVRVVGQCSVVYLPELKRMIALRQTNSSGFSWSMRKREVVASSMSKISAIPSTQSPSFLGKQDQLSY